MNSIPKAKYDFEIGLISGAIIVSIFFAILFYVTLNYIENLQKAQKYDQEQAKYWINGAIERGIVDICPTREGGIELRYKGVCPIPGGVFNGWKPVQRDI